VTTVVRLLKKNIRVINDDGSQASINVSREWYDRELLKNYDGQVTAGLRQPSPIKPLNLSHSLCQRILNFKVDCWVVDKPQVKGNRLRSKLREEILRIVREKRFKPNETLYNFVGGTRTVGSHKAYSAESSAELEPNHGNWAELIDADYQKIWYSDNIRITKSTEQTGFYPMFLFRFKFDVSRGDPNISVVSNNVKKIVLSFEGYGYNLAGMGVTIKVWNLASSTWDNAESGSGSSDETITITLTSNLTNYFDVDLTTGIGYLYLLARTTNPRSSAIVDIYCDYVKCVLTVEGLSHVKFGTFNDADDVSVKPFLLHSEFLVIGWMFENVSAT
jgi:hypothetical protein